MIDRKLPPKFSAQFTIALPKPEVHHLSNGISVFWVKNVDQPVVKIEVVYKAGKLFEPENGIAFFTAALLDKGTSRKSSSEIAEGFDQLGAQLESSSGLDYLTISLYSLNRTFDQAWVLFREILSEPSFPESELELSKQIQLQNLKVNNEKNSYVASKLIRKNVFGQSHPYGRYLEEGDILSMNVESIKQYFNKFTPHQIYITGAINPNELNQIISWLNDFKPVNNLNSTISNKTEKSREVVKKNNSIQSAIRFGKRAIKNTHPDYADALVFNHTLGGYFGSRLMKNIREEKGLTYGIYSSLNNFLADAFFSIGADVNKENVELTISEIHNELQNLQQVLMHHDELAIVKNHLLGNLQLELANPFSITEKIKTINLNKLPASFYQDLANSIFQVSPNSIREAANKHFYKEELSIVIVG